MKRSQVLAVSVLTLILLAAFPVQQSRASSVYSEKLNVFIAGSSAYWYFTFTGVNGSSKLAQFESSPGLRWYNVTAIRTTGWQSDFQVFGPKGYNLLPVPFIPPQGLFLKLGSDNYPDALAAAGRLDAYLMSSFVSLSNGTSSFEFYSPASFADIMPSTLLKLIPSSIGGFEAAIPTNFTSTLSPFVVLEGNQNSSVFSHSLVVGSISDQALDTKNRPNLLAYFGSRISSLRAASRSSSSTIQVHVLDGVLSSKDKATVINDTSRFTGSYTYDLTTAASKKVFGINATVLQKPLQLLAVRNVDVGVLQNQSSTSITISLTNPSSTASLDNVTFTDNLDTSLFKLVGDSPSSLFKAVGSSLTYSLHSLNASQSVTPTYSLRYIGNVTERVTIPAERVQVRFAYTIDGSTFHGRSWLNPVALSLGRDDAVVYAYVTPNENASPPVGATESLSLVVKNVGTRTASSVVANGQQIGGGLLAGQTHTFTIYRNATGLLDTNVTRKYSVTYIGVQQEPLNATTNQLPLEFSHSGMELGFATVVVGTNLAPLKVGSTAVNLTLSYSVTNAGSAGIDNFLAKVPLPPGLGCGVTNGTGISCASGLISLNYTRLTAQSSEVTYMKVNVTDRVNYFIPPLLFNGTTAGISFTGESNALAVPTGFILTKQFLPSLLFSGVNSKVTLLAANAGPFHMYNASIYSAADAFDTLSPLAEPSATSSSIAPGHNLNVSYVVTASTTYGNYSSYPIASSVFFGGTEFSLEGLGPFVSVYQPLSVTIKTTPSVPTEGKDFNLTLTIHNPAAVNVSRVIFTLPIPSGLTLSRLNNATVSKDVLNVSTPLLLPHSDYNATGVAVSNSGTTVPFDNANLTFVYRGATIKGTTPTKGILIGENVTSRYLIPIAIAFVALLAAVFYVRRTATSTVPASPK